jgi:ADP-ribose pyrophosphatase YjhB (NUDIX family)
MSKPSVPKVKRLYPNQPTVGIGAIIVKDSQILLEKRKNSPGRNKWSIPGGLVDLGENLEKAVIREVKEETCLDVLEVSLIDVVDDIEHDDEGKVKYHFVIIDYHAKVRSGVPKAASDAGELRWVPFGEVEAYNLTSSFRLFFHENRERLEKLNSYS